MPSLRSATSRTFGKGVFPQQGETETAKPAASNGAATAASGSGRMALRSPRRARPSTSMASPAALRQPRSGSKARTSTRRRAARAAATSSGRCAGSGSW